MDKFDSTTNNTFNNNKTPKPNEPTQAPINLKKNNHNQQNKNDRPKNPVDKNENPVNNKYKTNENNDQNFREIQGQKVQPNHPEGNQQSKPRKISQIDNCLPKNLRAKADFKRMLNTDLCCPRRFDLAGDNESKLCYMVGLWELDDPVISMDEIMTDDFEHGFQINEVENQK